MAHSKVVFVAFAIEDVLMRDLLKGQALNSRSPFEYTDMSVKDPYATDWKDKVRTRIRRSNGVIALISKNSLASTGQQWEVQCAAEESKPILGLWIYKDDRTQPAFMQGRRIISWDWTAIGTFIDGLP